MVLLTETVLFYWDCLDELHHESGSESKEEYAGIKDWAAKLKPLTPLLPHRSTSRSCHTKSVPNAGSLIKDSTGVTPGSTRPSTRRSFESDELMVVDDDIPVTQSLRKGVKRRQDNQVHFRMLFFVN